MWRINPVQIEWIINTYSMCFFFKSIGLFQQSVGTFLVQQTEKIQTEIDSRIA